MSSPISARAAILQALVSGGTYGIDLIDRIRATSIGVIELPQGSVYTILHDLEEEGLVRSRDGEPRQGRPRIHYKLTAKGRRAALKTREVVLALFAPEEEGEGIL